MRYHGTIAVLLIYRQEYSYKGKVFIIVYLCTKRYHGKAEGLKNELEDQFPQIKYLVSKNLSQNGEFVSQWEISKEVIPQRSQTSLYGINGQIILKNAKIADFLYYLVLSNTLQIKINNNNERISSSYLVM